MMVMSPTWGFWQKRMVRDEGAWARRARTTRNGTQSGSLCYKICCFILRTSPARDPRDYTCWRDAYATGRLHQNLHSQPRSVWKSRYGERARARACTHMSSLTRCFCLFVSGFVSKIFTMFLHWMSKSSPAPQTPLNSILSQTMRLFTHIRCCRLMTSNPVQQNSASSRNAVLLVM